MLGLLLEDFQIALMYRKMIKRCVEIEIPSNSQNTICYYANMMMQKVNVNSRYHLHKHMLSREVEESTGL